MTEDQFVAQGAERVDSLATPTPGYAIEVRGVRRALSAAWILRGVDLRVPTGQIVLLLGPNGAGKTTLLKILATLLRPTAGEGIVLGHDLKRDVERIRSRIGVLSHRLYLYEDLTALENLAFVQAMRGRDTQVEALVAALDTVGLGAFARTRVREFSNGMRQRVALARLQLGGARLWLLDEPFSGLDQEGAKTLNRLLAAFRAGGGSTLMASHRLGQALELADRLAVLVDGQIARDVPVGTMGVTEIERLYRDATGMLG